MFVKDQGRRGRKRPVKKKRGGETKRGGKKKIKNAVRRLFFINERSSKKSRAGGPSKGGNMEKGAEGRVRGGEFPSLKTLLQNGGEGRVGGGRRVEKTKGVRVNIR